MKLKDLVVSVRLLDVVACVVDSSCANKATSPLEFHDCLAHLLPVFDLNRTSYLQHIQFKLLLGEPGEEVKEEAIILVQHIKSSFQINRIFY